MIFLKKEKAGTKVDPIGLLVPVLLAAMWQAASSLGLLPDYKLPSPVHLLAVLADFFTGAWNLTPYSGTLWEHLFLSLRRVGTGFFTASVFGMAAGFLTGRTTLLRRLFDPLFQMLRAVPGIGWLPVAIVWFGVGETNTLFLISLAAFFPVYLNTAHSARAVPESLLRAGRMLGASGATLFCTVIFPAAFPQAAVGLRLALGVSWAYLVLGEVTGVSKGIGAVMNDGRMLGQVDIVLACMIVIAAAGKLTDFLLLAGIRRVTPGKKERRGNDG